MKNVFETSVWRCSVCHFWGSEKFTNCLPECKGEIVEVFYAEFWGMSDSEQTGIKMYRDEIKRLNDIIAQFGNITVKFNPDKPVVITRFLDGTINPTTDKD